MYRRPNHHHPRSPVRSRTAQAIHRPNRLRQWLQAQLHHSAHLPVCHLPRQNLSRVLPAARRSRRGLQTHHRWHHGLYGLLHYRMLLYNCSPVHEPRGAVGSECQGDVLECTNDQDTELCQCVVEHHYRRVVQCRHPHPIALEFADEQTAKVIADVHSRTWYLVSATPPPLQYFSIHTNNYQRHGRRSN